MNLVCPSHERRTSRVHFDDQLPISAPPMVSSTPMSYPLHHQRWSVPTDASYKASARQPERARFSVPATYGSAGIDINRGRSHYPWPSTQPSNSQQFNPGSPEDFPSRRYTISRVPVNTQTPSQPYDDRRGSDTTLLVGMTHLPHSLSGPRIIPINLLANRSVQHCAEVGAKLPPGWKPGTRSATSHPNVNLDLRVF